MTVEQLRETLPGYAKDLKLNLGSLLTDTVLTEQQRWGALLATALAARNPKLIEAISTEAAAHLTPEAVAAAKSAASIMAMNNIYYRFTHLASDRDYATMPARLRMNVIANPGVEKADFELWSLAVSAINGCGACIDSHDKVLRQAGVSREAIQQAVRIAAVIHAVAATLDGEASLAA
ncbi:MAG TPA: carboxymuconolactone decarboxylase family protein [Stellaceae bacterium]|jgi:alkyl hydroperoxide reductase subunit D|nr:carboxymuconolactone decarboxylase family protein [Stellaceae bacterium]